MTPEQLMIYRLRLHVALLERFCCSVSIGLLTQAGVSLDQAKSLLLEMIERGRTEMAPGIPTYPDPAQQAQAHDEFQEVVDGLRALVNSYS